MPEHKGQSCFNSLPARQAASWRRCVTKLAGFHTSPAFTPCWHHTGHWSITSRTTVLREFIPSRISLKTVIRENSPSRILLIPQYDWRQSLLSKGPFIKYGWGGRRIFRGEAAYFFASFEGGAAQFFARTVGGATYFFARKSENWMHYRSN